MKYQRGITLTGLLMASVLIGMVSLLGIKVAPEVIEYYKIQKAIKSMSLDDGLKGATVGDVRKAFARRAEVDQIDAISEADLDISKDGNRLVVSFSYAKRIPLFANVSLLIDFEGSTAK
jgi:hypothetical protein